MMDAILKDLAVQLEQANTPEEIFGELGKQVTAQGEGLRRKYHQLAKQVHPDAYRSSAEQMLAQSAFARLSEWHAKARLKIAYGIYGLRHDAAVSGQIVVKTAAHTYLLDEAAVQSSLLYRLYRGSYRKDGRLAAVTVKVPHDARDNDLVENEAAVVTRLRSTPHFHHYMPYFPRLIESFWYQQDGVGRQVNVFKREQDWVSLDEVRKAYPNGIDPKDMAWMWRRLLVALGAAHRCGVVHGAVLPSNVFILPAQHGLRLEEWSFAVSEPTLSGAYIAAIDPAYPGWYPREVLAKQNPLPATDIDMAARCMIALLGGDPLKNHLPGSVPAALHSFFQGCTLASARSRPQDAWAVKETFDTLILRLWGERKFHPFVMPEPRRS